jgi:hypothetical protein
VISIGTETKGGTPVTARSEQQELRHAIGSKVCSIGDTTSRRERIMQTSGSPLDVDRSLARHCPFSSLAAREGFQPTNRVYPDAPKVLHFSSPPMRLDTVYDISPLIIPQPHQKRNPKFDFPASSGCADASRILTFLHAESGYAAPFVSSSDPICTPTHSNHTVIKHAAAPPI